MKSKLAGKLYIDLAEEEDGKFDAGIDRLVTELRKVLGDATNPTVGSSSLLTAVATVSSIASSFVSSMRLSKEPLMMSALTKESLSARSNTNPSKPSSSSTLSSASSGSVTTVMTITIEEDLHGPPPFDAAAFKEKLAQLLDMQKEQFKVRIVPGRSDTGGEQRLYHEIQTSAHNFILVDVDKEGYLRREASSSETASDSESIDSESIDLETVNGGITFAITTALKQYGVAKENLKIIWPLEVGSVIMCIELDLKHALNLIDLKLRGDSALEKLRVSSCVLGEHRPSQATAGLTAVTEELYNEFDPALAEIIFAPDHFTALKLEKSVTLSDSDVNRAVKRAWLRAHPDRNLTRQDSFRDESGTASVSGTLPVQETAFVVPDAPLPVLPPSEPKLIDPVG